MENSRLAKALFLDASLPEIAMNMKLLDLSSLAPHPDSAESENKLIPLIQSRVYVVLRGNVWFELNPDFEGPNFESFASKAATKPEQNHPTGKEQDSKDVREESPDKEPKAKK